MNKGAIMSKIRILLGIWGLGMCLACQQKNEAVWNIEVENSVESMSVSDIADTVKYIRLETTPEALIGTIYDVQVLDSMIFILETLPVSRILCFTTDGRFRYKIDALGKGPEEYRDLESFTIDPQRKVLVLNERTRKRIHFYDAVTGRRMGDKAGGCYFTSFAALSDGGYLLLGEQGLKYRYLLVDSLFREEGGVVKNNENLDIEYPFVLTCQNECVWFADLKNSAIYYLDRNTKCIKSAAQVDFGANKVPQNWFESPENKKDFIVEEVMKKNLSLGIGGVMKWRNGIVFTYSQGVGDAILPRWCVAEEKQESISVMSWLYDDYNDVKLSMFPFFCLSDCIGGYIAPQDFDYSGIRRLYPDLTMNDNYVLYLIQCENGNK